MVSVVLDGDERVTGDAQYLYRARVEVVNFKPSMGGMSGGGGVGEGRQAGGALGFRV